MAKFNSIIIDGNAKIENSVTYFVDVRFGTIGDKFWRGCIDSEAQKCGWSKKSSRISSVDQQKFQNLSAVPLYSQGLQFCT